MNAIAIIPARGGSKRIPNKNIKLFSGKPIIAYSIKAAKNTGLFKDIIVSTDSNKIAEIAIAFGARAPFIRPDYLSNDYADTASVMIHALNWLEQKEILPDYFCCIYATAPFVSVNDIEKGFELLQTKSAATVYPVTSFAYPIFRALKMDNNGKLEMFWPEHIESRTQDLPCAYHDAGQFYWANTRKFLEEKKLYTKESYSILLERCKVIDIDTMEDWVIAEQMFKAFRRK